ncbi:helix-turn-helix transcriptional regulator [Loigolactobacillus coryniformis subsp. torquens]|nr:helix-turn-helix transcriptional regulator [Loigolactobacillus coryniformis]MBW4801862.1 helix-turn-helix transcriptional regulator [Loigolactobacillus coryniformis subsp. torquens]MBW4804563.1 helix-turn-helix transcriptional regulator [Loigolactobacillus coryniformis subsp. torquens]
MPIRIDLDVVMAQKKMTVTQLASAVGITMPNISILKTGKAKAIRFSTLEKICEVLDCQPGDILKFVPDQTVE